MLEQYKWRANPVGELAYFYLKTTWRPATTHADLMTIWLNAPTACPKCLARLPGCQGHCALETRSLRALQKPSTLKALQKPCRRSTLKGCLRNVVAFGT